MTTVTIPDGAFTMRRQFRFSDCDPAGIVFYVEFFRMFNDVFEDWISQVIGVPFVDQFFVHDRMFPVLHTDVDFKEPRGMGDTLDLTLVLTKLGRSSITYTIIGHDEGVECLRANFVNCYASKSSGTSLPLPDTMRASMESYLAMCQGNSG